MIFRMINEEFFLVRLDLLLLFVIKTNFNLKNVKLTSK